MMEWRPPATRADMTLALTGRVSFPIIPAKVSGRALSFGSWAKSQTENRGQECRGHKRTLGSRGCSQHHLNHLVWKSVVGSLFKGWGQRFRMTEFLKLNRISLERLLGLLCLTSSYIKDTWTCMFVPFRFIHLINTAPRISYLPGTVLGTGI